MKKIDWDEPVPVYGAFGVFLGWETRGVNYTKKSLPIVMCLVILKEAWDLLRFRHI